MNRTITSITDAHNLVSDWTEQYLEAPTDAQVERAARILVDWVGGYAVTGAEPGTGVYGASPDDERFDLDVALVGSEDDVLAMFRDAGRSAPRVRRWR